MTTIVGLSAGLYLSMVEARMGRIEDFDFKFLPKPIIDSDGRVDMGVIIAGTAFCYGVARQIYLNYRRARELEPFLQGRNRK